MSVEQSLKKFEHKIQDQAQTLIRKPISEELEKLHHLKPPPQVEQAIKKIENKVHHTQEELTKLRQHEKEMKHHPHIPYVGEMEKKATIGGRKLLHDLKNAEHKIEHGLKNAEHQGEHAVKNTVHQGEHQVKAAESNLKRKATGLVNDAQKQFGAAEHQVKHKAEMEIKNVSHTVHDQVAHAQEQVDKRLHQGMEALKHFHF